MARHLIHIGYPKAGSTFLQAWFEKHPELRYKPGGLGGFHNVYELARPSGKSYKYHVTSFEGLATPLGGAATLEPDYERAERETDEQWREHQAGVCALLKSLYPGSRVLIITRGFKALLLSGYSQYVRTGGKRHLRDMWLRTSDGARQSHVRYYDFDHLIGLYAGAFGEENLIVLPYELLRDDQAKFVAVLEERLGLAHADIRVGRLNPSLSPEELYWYPLISRAVSSAASRLGSARSKDIHGWYVRRALDNRLRPLVKVLSLLRPGRKITRDDFPEDVLGCFKGKATRLKDNPLYAPYAAEYLWDS